MSRMSQVFSRQYLRLLFPTNSGDRRIMPIADTPLQGLAFTAILVTSMAIMFTLGVILEHRRMKRRIQ